MRRGRERHPAPGTPRAARSSAPRGSWPRWATPRTGRVAPGSLHSSSTLRCWATRPASQVSCVVLGQDAVGDQQVRRARTAGRVRRAARRTASAPAGPGSATSRTLVPAVLDDGRDGGQFDVPAGGRLVQPLGGHRDPGEPAEDGPQRAGRLAFGREEPPQIPPQFLRETEQRRVPAVRAAGRRRAGRRPRDSAASRSARSRASSSAPGRGVSSSASRRPAPQQVEHGRRRVPGRRRDPAGSAPPRRAATR